MRPLVAFALAASSLVTANAAGAAEFYVSPSGTSGGDGSQGAPWDLATALAQPAAVQPGDTIWLLGGTYGGTFQSSLRGTADAPIIVRQKPGERATIDGGDSGGNGIFVVYGTYTWFWGFEVTSSDPNRVSSQTGSSPTDIGRGEGVQIAQVDGAGVGVKFINLVVHDTRQGFSFWTEAEDAEINGCIVYYNGWEAPDRGHGHAIYTQNETGTKTLADDILFDQFGYGIHAYGSDNAHLQGFDVEGVVSFDNGRLGTIDPGYNTNILLGGESGPNGYSVLSRIVEKDNATYSSDGASLQGDDELGYAAGCSTDVTVSGNYFAQATALSLVGCSVASIANNTFIGGVSGFDMSQYPNNTFSSGPPNATKVFVRPNAYEPGRANVVVYDWAHASSVDVDLGPANLAVGAPIEIRDAQNFFGDPVVSTTYDGGAVSIPMTGLTKAAPVGTAAPMHTAPEFGVFVVLGKAAPTTTGPGAGGGSSSGPSGPGAGPGAGGSSGKGGGAGGGADDTAQGRGCSCRVGGGDDAPDSTWLVASAGALWASSRRRRLGRR
ncbi:MAG TPA: MYXO-CTERM sorting domain-containing protein [Minicystis sp.]|nr:MYXO-CTERM sorting domain-containing protein [Minicystis sp.]